jgi:hypothetical protein
MKPDTRTQLAAHVREDLKTLGLHRRVKSTSIGDILNGAEEHEAGTSSSNDNVQ